MLSSTAHPSVAIGASTPMPNAKDLPAVERQHVKCNIALTAIISAFSNQCNFEAEAFRGNGVCTRHCFVSSSNFPEAKA